MSNFNYLAFIHGTLPQPGETAIADGAELAEQCLAQLRELEAPEQFPPRLLILLVSSRYLEAFGPSPETSASQLLRGIHQTFAKTPESHGGNVPPLIGSTVAAVFFKHPDFDNRVHEKGALLICLASRLIEAHVAVGRNARQDSEGAIKEIFKEFGLDPDGKVDPNPLADRMLFTFFPGFGEQDVTPAYPAPDLQRRLRQGSRTRIRVAGGVSSAGGPFRAAHTFQFAGKEVIKDAVVSARIISGSPIGTSLAHGLTPTGQIVRVKKLSQDKKTIEEFEEGIPTEVLRGAGESVLLGRLSSDCEPMIIVPRTSENGSNVPLFREIKDRDMFEILKPEPAKILTAAIDCVAQARDRILIQNPIGNLMLIGNQWRFRYPRVGLNVEHNLRVIEQKIPGAVCIGGFVDGQVGEDETGRSQFGNGSVMSMVFGDEMRERTPLHRGFKALAECGPRMTGTKSIAEAIEEAIRIVVEAGFPGAMLSLMLRDGENKYLIAQKARGIRFEKIVDETKRLFGGRDILSAVAHERLPRFIKDSRLDPDCDQKAVEKSGIISQYVLPLLRLDGKVLGILQVDLGSVSSLSATEKEVLYALGAIIGASLNRLQNWVEASIGRELDPALNKALAANSVEEGLDHLIHEAVSAFGVEIGYVRLANYQTHKLTLVAGVGELYRRANDVRRETTFDDITPICLAFNQNGGRSTIVNNTQNDFAYQQMRTNYASHLLLMNALKTMKSYASIAFENEAGIKLGALCLAATKEWYFTRSHMYALKALGKRIGYLVEHFSRKDSERIALNRVQFILNSGPRLAAIKNLDDFSGELEKAIEKFCQNVKADWGSLYLLDNDRQHYILRAQYGWKNPSWVNAARYQVNDLWAGASPVEGCPLHIADLRQHYIERGYPDQYMMHAFGFIPDKDNIVEGIGLPLKVGEDKIGILTLYRRKEKAESGFAILDHPDSVQQWEDIYLEGASDIAGLASVLRSRRREQWEKEEVKRRQRISNNLNLQNDHRPFETRVCQEVLKSFRAVRVDFYKADEDLLGPQLFWMDGFCRDPKTKCITDDIPLPDDSSILVKKALATKEIIVDYVSITDHERQNIPGLAAIENLVNRACIPLVAEGKRLGVLDLYWYIGPNQANSLLVLHDKDQLRALGTSIGSMYLRHQIRIEAERSRHATEVAGAYSFQQAHRLGNIAQRIYRLAQTIKNTLSSEERAIAINELQNAADFTSRITDSVINHGARVKNQSPKQHLLEHLLKTAQQEVEQDNPKSIQSIGIQLTVDVPKNLAVYADFILTKEVFVNILNNAIKAILDKALSIVITIEKRITITASTSEDRRNAVIIFEDTGIGMSENQKDNAMRGFFNTQGHKGIGVLISRVLLAAQSGELKYDTKEGYGTKAIVTLPLAYKEDKPKIIS